MVDAKKSLDREQRVSNEILVGSLAAHPHLAPAVVDIAWASWGDGLPQEEYERWLRLAQEDARRNSRFSAGFVALHEGQAVGTVQLHEFDIEAMADRSPWVCGMIVKPEYRGKGIGRRLLAALESFAASRGVDTVWVFTGAAAGFYQQCGWSSFGERVHEGEPGTVLSKKLGQ